MMVSCVESLSRSALSHKLHLCTLPNPGSGRAHFDLPACRANCGGRADTAENHRPACSPITFQWGSRGRSGAPSRSAKPRLAKEPPKSHLLASPEKKQKAKRCREAETIEIPPNLSHPQHGVDFGTGTGGILSGQRYHILYMLYWGLLRI